MIALGYAREAVLHTVGLVDRSEFKRQQAPPGLRITGTAFGAGRRMPIARGQLRITHDPSRDINRDSSKSTCQVDFFVDQRNT